MYIAEHLEDALHRELLFNGERFYDFVEGQQDRFQKAYERLSDDQALEREHVDALKLSFMMQVPTIKHDPNAWTADDSKEEVVIYIPFEGDSSIFTVSPEAYNGTISTGTIVGEEVVLRVSPTPGFDVSGHVRRELANIEWRLNYLRGGNEHLKQQLDIRAAECMASRRRAVESRAQVRRELGIPRRQPPVPSAAPVAKRYSAPTVAVKPSLTQTWDVFISHASADKPYVKPLVEELKKAGVEVWFDEQSLSWGDQLRPGINNGLLNSRYAIVVLSKKFLEVRKWTEHELNGLFARENVGQLIILPIWHGITHEDLLAYDPALADRLAKVSETDSYADIVSKFLEILGCSAT
jgi:hypothetical protein